MRRAAIVIACLGVSTGCSPSSDNCGGFCGEGTVCQSGRCVVAPPPQDQAEPEPESETPDKGKRRRRRGRRADGDDPAPAGGLSDTDDQIPRYRPDRDEQLGEGSERLSDRTIRQQLHGLEPAFNRCLSRAAEVTDAPLAGSVTFQVGIEPSGKVWGVNARLPASWSVPGLRACFRRVIYEHRFPAWDGPAMGVDYHFQVD